MIVPFKKLTKKELIHIAESVQPVYLKTLEHLVKVRKSNNYETFNEPCWECRNIARKLELPI